MKPRDIAFIILAVILWGVINLKQNVEILKRMDVIENKTVHYLLPKDAECAVKMMYFGTSKPTSRMVCHWKQK